MEGGFEGGFARPPPVPKMVQDFVVYLYRHIRERNVREVYVMYSNTFPHLSERFFKGTTWPTAEVVSHLVDDDHIFCLLYKEMWYRHLYASSKPTLAQRVESWDNYRELFGVILSSNLNMQLPNGWLWDMVDEFVYQFQSFCQYRGKVSGKTPEEVEALRRCEGVWDPTAVANYLGELVARSGIREELSQPGAVERLYESDGYDPRQSNVRRMLGYFSLIGLLRVHSVLGDYTAAMQSIHPLNPMEPRMLFTSKIAMSHITLYYYAGFCYLMMQRYLDAAKCFNTVLTYIAKVKQHHARGVAYDQILKKNEQMYALLASILALCPAAARCVEDSVHTTLREKYGEKMRQMGAGSSATYEELFAYACPKFVAPNSPDYTNPQTNTNLEAYRAQLSVFMAVVEERRHLPALKQFLKLYSSISVSKLAHLAEIDEATLRAQLALMQHVGQVVTWTRGDALQGAPQLASDIDFTIEGQGGEEMVVVKESKAQAVKGDFLARHIHKFEEIIRDLESIPSQPAAAQPAQPVAAH